MPKKKASRHFDSEKNDNSPKKRKVDFTNSENTSENQEIECHSPHKDAFIFLKCENNTEGASEDDEITPDIIQHIEEGIDNELDKKAQRNNLTARNVKNMIKAVITDSEVLKMVDYTLQKTEEKPVYELKLTRAKTKELIGLEQNAIFNIPPAPKKSEIEALITEELPEDSSDEEYEPHCEFSEDDESKASEAGIPEDDSELDTSVRTEASQDDSRVDVIGHRTRSKFSLSETPLEAIEQAFIPPDITTDMYNTDCDNEDWLNFLKEFSQPLDAKQEVNDDENDPEYNVMVDEECDATDKEELRADRAVKVTKKELNELMSELFEYTEMLSSDDEESEPKNNSVDKFIVENVQQQARDNEGFLAPENIVSGLSKQQECFSETVEKILSEEETELNAEFLQLSSGNVLAVVSHSESTIRFHPLQICLLKQQLQQHVQLLLQSCLLLVGLPFDNGSFLSTCKTSLSELLALKTNKPENSLFNILNLSSSLKLLDQWIDIATSSAESENIQEFLKLEHEKVVAKRERKVRYPPELPPELVKICLESNAFPYPLLLPSGGFSEPFSNGEHMKFIESEVQLLVMGLGEFSTYLQKNLDIKHDLMETLFYLEKYLLPNRTAEQLHNHVRNQMRSKKSNPVKEFFLTNEVPKIEHFVVMSSELKVLSDFDSEFFPESWKKYL